MAGSDTPSFDAPHHEVESERSRLMRRRLLWCCLLLTGIGLFVAAFEAFSYEPARIDSESMPSWLRGVLGFLLSNFAETLFDTAIFAGFAAFVHRRALSAQGVITTASWFVLGTMAFTMMHMSLIQIAGPSEGFIDDFVGSMFAALAVLHGLVSLFVPWTPWQAARPLIPIVVVHAFLVLIAGRGSFVQVAGSILVTALAGAPGVLIAWWRSREGDELVRLRAMSGRFRSLAQDLVDARRIHEAIFPRPITDGPVRLAFHYEPSMHIGGDFVYARTDTLPGKPLPVLSVVVVDVTGHGVGSALAVNRLHAELERTLARDPGTGPGRLLGDLNDYLHYTLAIHSVYASALCLRFDPNESGRELSWASGGHPPAILRRADGHMERLWSSAFVLGTVPGNEYDADERAGPFSLGDTLVAYTDGAIEARTPDGAMIGIDGLEDMVRNLTREQRDADRIARSLARAVDAGRAPGPVSDDTLIVVVQRPAPAPSGDQPMTSGSSESPSVRSLGPDSVTSTSAS